MAQPRTKNWEWQAALCGALCAYQIYDTATATEAPPQALALLDYFIIASTLLGFVGALVMMAKADATRG